MKPESTDESPSEAPDVPEGFGGIMDPHYNQVHKDLYGDGDVDIPLDTAEQEARIEASMKDTDTVKEAATTGYNYGYDRLAAYQIALDLAVKSLPNADTDAIVQRAQKFADFLVSPLQ